MNSTFASLEAPATYASSHSFQIRKILLAHDGSIPATQALSDAATLARRFGSEIVVAHVQSPEEASPDDLSQAACKTSRNGGVVRDRERADESRSSLTHNAADGRCWRRPDECVS